MSEAKWYTLDEVDAILKSPKPSQEDYKVWSEEWHNNSPALRRKGDRQVSVDLSPSRKAYTGRIYGQGWEYTCLPWTVANAIKAAGSTPKASFIWSLLNVCSYNAERRNDGMNHHDLEQSLRHESQDNFECLLLEEGLLSTSVHRSPFKAHRETRDKAFAQRIEDAIVRRNAILIKRHVDAGGVLLAQLDYESYTGIKERGTHAICLSGYAIDTSTYMSVQLLDSSRGEVWTSLEHLSQSVDLATDLVRRRGTGINPNLPIFSIDPIFRVILAGN